MKAIRRDGIINADMVDNNLMMKCMVHQSSSRYDGIRSAVNRVYILVKSTNAINNEKRAINIYFRNGDNSNCGETYTWYQNFRRKKPISLKAYELLAKTLFEIG